MRLFDFENGPRRHMVKRAVMADEEFIHSVFGDMPLDRLQQGGIDGGRRVAVTDEEADTQGINSGFQNGRLQGTLPIHGNLAEAALERRLPCVRGAVELARLRG